MSNNVSTGYKSFSGQDTLVFILFPNSKPVLIGSITTLSWSIYRNKKQVMVIGRISPSGVSKGIRVVAGTMVFTVINQHWMEELKKFIPNLNVKMKSDELPPFDLIIVSANEYGAAISTTIYGASITEEGGVVSVEDMFSENTVKYIGRDIDNFSSCDIEYNKTRTISNYSFGLYNTHSTNNYKSKTSRVLDSINSTYEEYKSRMYISAMSYFALLDINNCKVLNNRLVPINIYTDNTGYEVKGKLYPFDEIYEIEDSVEYIKTEYGYIKKSDTLVKIPYSNNKSEDVVYDIIKDYNLKLKHYISIENIENKLTVKFGLNEIYKDGTNKTFFKQKDISNNTVFDLKDFNKYIIYDEEKGFPETIEFIVYPYGYEAIKLSLMVKEGV